MERSSLLRGVSGLILLMGITILITLGEFWPWVLALLGISVLPMALGRGTAPLIGSLLFALALTAVAAMIESDWLWPGLVYLVVALLVVRFVALSVRSQR